MFFRRKKDVPVGFDERLERARAAGFRVEPEARAPARYRIEKSGCAAVIGRADQDGAVFVEMPGVSMDGEIARLVDRGFQKFLSTSKTSRPATAEQLRAVHHFDEELRRALQIPALYNESLGTVSNRYVYDRVEGRE